MSLWDTVVAHVAPPVASKNLLLREMKEKGIPTSGMGEACLSDLAAWNLRRARSDASAKPQGISAALLSSTRQTADRLAEIYCLRTPEAREPRARNEIREELLTVLRKHGVLAATR
jgi:hypothetical protein